MQTSKKMQLTINRNNKRLWLTQGTIADASLAANDHLDLEYDYDNLAISIFKSDSPTRNKVSDTHKGPIIDLNNKKISAIFADFEHVEVISGDGVIYVKGSHAESKVIEREHALVSRVKTGQPLRKGGAFTGLGLLCRSVHRGLRKAGVSVKQRFANEFNPIPAEVNLSGNEIWDDAFDDAVFVVDDIYTMDMNRVPKLDLLVMGSPCPAFSQVNTRLKKEGKTDIFHPESGTIFQPILEVIRRSNPAIVLLENSKFFSGSIFDYIMSDVMERFGYIKTETVVTGTGFGDFEKRERLCRMWVSKGLGEIDLNNLPNQKLNTRSFESILEPISDDDSRWGRRKYLESKNAEAHNGHKYCVTDLKATKVPTLGANYHKIQADSPMVAHPSIPLYTRIITPSEHCNLRSISGRLKENIVAIAEGTHYIQKSDRGSVSETHKMLGNSCSPLPWESVGQRMGEWILMISGMIKKPIANSVTNSANLIPALSETIQECINVEKYGEDQLTFNF